MSRPVLGAVGIGALIAFAAPAASPQSVERISVADDGSESDGASTACSLSADGTIVGFESEATNLVAGDTNGVRDVFVRDRVAGTTRRVSVSSSGVEGNDVSFSPRVSADGRFVLFNSLATNLVANALPRAAYLHEMATGATSLLTINRSGQPDVGFGGDVSADGRYVTFTSASSDYVSGDTNDEYDVFRLDRQDGSFLRVSIGNGGLESDRRSDPAAMSPDGRFVVFTTACSLDPDDSNGSTDVYVRDLVNGTTTLASRGETDAVGAQDCWLASISDDGRYVAFSSDSSDLVAGDSCGRDILVRDLVAGATWCASVDSDGGFRDCVGAVDSDQPKISGDGRFVFFRSDADSLVLNDGNHQSDVLCRDVALAMTTQLSRAADGTEGDAYSGGPDASPDGAVVAFVSFATDLVPGDANQEADVFLLERRFDAAYAKNYGSGWPGTHGVPTLVAPVLPQLNVEEPLAISNSSGRWTVAVVFLGLSAVQWPTGFGGDLLVDPLVTIMIPLPPSGDTFAGRVPPDDWLAGLALFLQVIEADRGASDGVSFTDGLELGLGY